MNAKSPAGRQSKPSPQQQSPRAAAAKRAAEERPGAMRTQANSAPGAKPAPKRTAVSSSASAPRLGASSPRKSGSSSPKAGGVSSARVFTPLNWVLCGVLVVCLGLVFTVGGNLANGITGGSFAHGWYSSEGVFARLFSEEKEEEVLTVQSAPQAEVKPAAPAPPNQHDNPLNLTPASHLLTYRVNAQVYAKPAPQGAANVSAFTVGSRIQCVLGAAVTCDVARDSEHYVRYTLNAQGAGTGTVVNAPLAASSSPLLSSGASTANDSYACTAEGETVNCWNVSTGRGFKVSATSAESYIPQLKYPSGYRGWGDSSDSSTEEAAEEAAGGDGEATETPGDDSAR